MHRRHFVGLSSAIALATMTGLSRFDVRAQAAYSAVDLGAPEGLDAVVPVALNNNGAAVVMATSTDATSVFIFENGKYSQIGASNEQVFASSINDKNQVSGWVSGKSDDSRPSTETPVMLTTSGQVEMPGGRLDGRVYAVASDGRAVGEAAVDKGQARRAVIWDNQEVSELKGTPDDGASSAHDINGLGQIVGWIGSPDGNQRKAVIFSLAEDPVELGTLGGTLSEAIAISEQGMIVGNSSTSEEQTALGGNGTAAFGWIDGSITAFQTLDNQAWSTAADVNSYGLVAGTVGLSAPATVGPATTAVVWAPDAVLDLNQLIQPLDGLTLTAAVAINELGQVLCTAVDSAGVTHAVLLSVLGN